MPFSLLQLSQEQHLELAKSGVPPGFASQAEPDALPPPHVLARVKKQLDEGCPPFWTCTFAIVREQDQRIIGGCGFKGQPLNGRVEIGYGVSPTCRREGAATFAVGQLLKLAFASEVKEVLAQILPDNIASAGVVQKHNFRNTGNNFDRDGTLVVEWVASQ